MLKGGGLKQFYGGSKRVIFSTNMANDLY
uniref:Uncharacterized protein n=1 Tax=Rhizophora mucronata TaxID=61149 RepID=A0A2P2NUU1_RHIMU